MSEKRFEELNLKDAFLFGAALKDPETCRLVLELILDRPVEKVNVHTEHTLMYSSDFRSARLDVYADSRAENELQVGYDLEMQNDDRKKLAKRARFYQAEIDAGALKPGEDTDQLKPSYVIFICTFDPFGCGLYRYTFEERCLEKGFPLGDGTCKIFLSTKGRNDGEVPEALVEFLRYVEQSDDACVSGLKDERIHKLHGQIEELKKSREWRGQYMRFEELLQESEAKGEAAGLKKGEAIGLKKGEASMLELIAKMIENGEGNLVPKLREDAKLLARMKEKYGK